MATIHFYKPEPKDELPATDFRSDAEARSLIHNDLAAMKRMVFEIEQWVNTATRYENSELRAWHLMEARNRAQNLHLTSHTLWRSLADATEGERVLSHEQGRGAMTADQMDLFPSYIRA